MGAGGSIFLWKVEFFAEKIIVLEPNIPSKIVKSKCLQPDLAMNKNSVKWKKERKIFVEVLKQLKNLSCKGYNDVFNKVKAKTERVKYLMETFRFSQTDVGVQGGTQIMILSFLPSINNFNTSVHTRSFR